MGAFGGSNTVEDGLAFAVDPGNLQCWQPNTSASGSCEDLILNAVGDLTTDSMPSSAGQGSWQFDGTDDKVNFPPLDSILSGVSQLTLSFWFQIDDTGETRWMGKYNDVDQWLSIQKNADGYIYFIVSDGVSYMYGRYSGSGLSLNTWYQYVAVFDGTLTGNANRCKMYLNAEQQSLGFYGTIPATTYDFELIGTYPFMVGGDGFNNNCDGLLSCIMIYNRALTSSEILQNYTVTKDRFGL